MKTARHQKILSLIEENSIDRQEELLRFLKESGFSVTQATVSRDIRELCLVKTSTGNGSYRYMPPSEMSRGAQRPNKTRFEMIFKESVIKVDYAGHIVLVKCYTGMANAACGMFDTMVWDDVVGTLSGDDTFFVLMRSEEAAHKIVMDMKKHISSEND